MDQQETGVHYKPEAIEAVRVMCNTPGWIDFMVPAINGLRADWLVQLIDPSVERVGRHSDDYIRGCVATLDVLLGLPAAAIAELDALVEAKKKEQEQSNDWTARAETGVLSAFPNDSPPTGEEVYHV